MEKRVAVGQDTDPDCPVDRKGTMRLAVVRAVPCLTGLELVLLVLESSLLVFGEDLESAEVVNVAYKLRFR